LYASADGGSGRIEIHRLGNDAQCVNPQTGQALGAGCLVDPAGTAVLPSMCRQQGPKNARSHETPPLSERHKLQNPKAFILHDGMIYIEERFLRRLTAFQLSPEGVFCPACPIQNKIKCGVQPQPTYTAADKNFGTPCDGFQPLRTPECVSRQAK